MVKSKKRKTPPKPPPRKAVPPKKRRATLASKPTKPGAPKRRGGSAKATSTSSGATTQWCPSQKGKAKRVASAKAKTLNSPASARKATKPTKRKATLVVAEAGPPALPPRRSI